MKKKLTIVALSIISGFSFVAFTTSTIAWFTAGTHIGFGDDPGNVDISGGSNASYYESGSGASNDPYIISDSIHLYNLAWLQYIGYYNSYKTTFHDDAPSDIVQNYFKLKNNIDMGGLTLPPIGTEKYPFLGNFDGNGCTISNFTISNDNPTLSSSDFGVAKPANFYGGTQPEVVGFFGVVGKLPAQSITYDSSIVGFYDVTLSNFTVRAKTNQVLIGLAAGYVNGELSNVKLDGTATLDVDGQVSTAKTSITDKLSEYALVGYSTKEASNGAYDQKLSEYYDSEEAAGSEEGENWGGSIDMNSLYKRLKKVYNEESYDNGSFSVTTATDPNGVVTKQKTENKANHYSGYYGDDYSYTFNKNANNTQDIFFLYGDYSPVSGTIDSTDITLVSQTVSGTQYKISQASDSTYYFYVTVSGTTHYLKMPQLTKTGTVNLTSSDDTTNINQATKFIRAANGNSGGYRYYVNQTINGTVYPVYIGLYSGATARAIQYNPDSASNKNYTTFYNSGSNYYVIYSNKNYFLQYSGSKWAGTTSTTNRALQGQNAGTTSYLTATPNLTTTTNAADADIWYLLENKLFTIKDSRIHYLSGTNNAITLSENKPKTEATNWTYSNNALSYTYNATTYYLDFAGSISPKTSKGNNITLTNVGTANLENQLYTSSISHSTPSIPVNSFKNSYVPLSVNKNNIYQTNSTNTGYIVSGKTYVNPNYDSDGETNYYNSGDIRVARYDMNNIENALGQTTYDNSKLFCITATSNSDYALITDSYNSSSEPGSGLSSITGRKASTSLQRYNDWENNTGARDAMGTVFTEDSSSIYGLHFMDATISSSNTVSIPGAKMGGKTFGSLTVPKDSIDFLVNENGYITFFAGTYFSGNSSFFSLHKIERNESTNAITSITQIQTIYKDANNNYYYNPVDTSGKTKVFDTAVLTSPSKFIDNAVYYFEVPVGPGEYALGSVSGKNGAYLMYLDISASGEHTISDSYSAYAITTTRGGNAYPVGVDFAVVDVDTDGGDSIGLYINSSQKGTVVFTVSNNGALISVSSVSGTTQVGSYAFTGPGYDDDFSVEGMSGAPPTISQGGMRSLVVDVSLTTGDTYKVIIEDDLDGEGTITGSRYYLGVGSATPSSTSLASIQSTITMLTNETIGVLRELTTVVTLTRTNGLNEFSTSYDTENCSYNDKKIDVDIIINGCEITVGTITTGYEFYVGGVRKYATNIIN